MSFKARIFIQGVGVYVPHGDPPTKLEVLFPDSSQPHLAEAERLKDAEGQFFGQHWAVVQFSQRNLTPKADDHWLTTELSGYRLRIESNPKPPLTFAGGKNRLIGLPVLEDHLEAVHLSDVLPVDPNLQPAATIAKLEVVSGIVGPDLEYLGNWEWDDVRDGKPVETSGEFTSVMRVELGVVNKLVLNFEPLAGNPPLNPIVLQGAAGVCDVWVRHDCNPNAKPVDPASPGCKFADRPGPQPSTVSPGDADVDFPLNFALSSDPTKVRQTTLPRLRVHKSWQGGSPIGGWPQQCMGGQTRP